MDVKLQLMLSITSNRFSKLLVQQLVLLFYLFFCNGKKKLYSKVLGPTTIFPLHFLHLFSILKIPWMIKQATVIIYLAYIATF